jgi:7-cyano-7-deazaguanine reductase
MANEPSKTLDTFANPAADRDYTITVELPEFTCLCPLTGQPDFATIRLDYIPDARCIELKSLKLYIWSYRDEGAYHEAIANRILDDIVRACVPRFARITAKFNVRGGTYPSIITEFRAPGWFGRE